MVSIVVPILAAKWGAGNSARGYQAAMGLMAAIGVAFFLFCFFTTTERVEHQTEKKPLLEKIKLLFRNDQWLILCAVCVTGTVGYVIRGAVAIYYAKYFLGGDANFQSAFMGTGVVAAVLAMVASTWITKSFCKIQLFRWSQLLVAALAQNCLCAAQFAPWWLVYAGLLWCPSLEGAPSGLLCAYPHKYHVKCGFRFSPGTTWVVI